jgi:hypothetical protein
MLHLPEQDEPQKARDKDDGTGIEESKRSDLLLNAKAQQQITYAKGKDDPKREADQPHRKE